MIVFVLVGWLVGWLDFMAYQTLFYDILSFNAKSIFMQIVSSI